jgi:hypothetical protein
MKRKPPPEEIIYKLKTEVEEAYFAGWGWISNTKAKAKGVKRFIDIPQETIEIPDIELKGFVPR